MKKKIKIFLLFVFVFSMGIANILVAQISDGGKPAGISIKSKTQIPFIRMPSFDVGKMIKENAINEKMQLKPFRFAKVFTINIDVQRSGRWDTLENGTRICRLGFKSPGAYSLNLIFSEFELPKGAKLFIYNEENNHILGAFTYKNNKKSKIFPVSPIVGDAIIVEYQVPAGTKQKAKLCVGQVAHDYKNIFNYLTSKDGNYGNSGICNVDINCPEGDEWQKEKYSVCRIIIDGSVLCSGVLINNTNNDGTPYFITANHCVADSSEAASLVLFFDYESPYCNGTDGYTSKTISSSYLKATTTNKLDFSLIVLSSNPPFLYKPYYAGWSIDTTAASNTTCIHHPGGDVKKISSDNDPPSTGNFGSNFDDNSHWLIHEWELGTTEGGSSGSPLFNQNHKVIGTLTGGDADCIDPVNDYFAKFSLFWDKYTDPAQQLKFWLDPIDSDVISLEGFEPYADFKATCDTFSNLLAEEPQLIYGFDESVWGYRTGHNALEFSQYAEKFSGFVSGTVSGVFLNVAKAYDASEMSSSSITLKIWEGGDEPGEIIIEKSVLLNYFQDSTVNFVEFDSLIEISGEFYVGYEIYYNDPVDTFALFQSEKRGFGSLNTAFAFSNSSWSSFDEIYSGDFNTSLGLSVVLCSSVKSEIVETNLYKNVLIYPNPASDYIFVNLGQTFLNEIELKVFDITGNLINVKKRLFSNNRFQLDFSSQPTGLYFLVIRTNNSIVTKKISIIK